MARPGGPTEPPPTSVSVALFEIDYIEQRFELVLQMRKNFIDDGAIFDNRNDLHLSPALIFCDFGSLREI